MAASRSRARQARSSMGIPVFLGTATSWDTSTWSAQAARPAGTRRSRTTRRAPALDALPANTRTRPAGRRANRAPAARAHRRARTLATTARQIHRPHIQHLPTVGAFGRRAVLTVATARTGFWLLLRMEARSARLLISPQRHVRLVMATAPARLRCQDPMPGSAMHEW
jgi:hypothetical protein